MTVYKNFLKLSWKYKASSLIFIGIFMTISFIFLFGGATSSQNEFKESSLDLKILDLDNSELSKNLIKYLESKNNVTIINEKNVKHSASSNSESLNVEDGFIKEIKKDISLNLFDAGIIIQNGLQEKLNDNEALVLTYKDDRSNSAFYIDMQINKFLRFANAVKNETGKYDFNKINSALSESVVVNKIEHKKNFSINIWFLKFFNFFGWMLFSLILNLIGRVLFKLNYETIQMRNNVSSISNTRFALERLLAQLSVIVSVSAFLIAIVLVINHNKLANVPILIYCLNEFAFAIVILAMLFLLNTITHSSSVIGIMGSVLPLALAFISGVFVPVEVLPANILRIAKLFPLYYLLEANKFCFESNMPDWQNLGILVLFFVLYFSVGVYFYKVKRQKNSISISNGGLKAF